jgi:predicted neuraminidase
VNRVHVRETLVFDGWQGYRLACAATLAQAPNGDLLCCWMSGSGHEPADDNCVLLARSTDRGRTWSEPQLWLPPIEGKDGQDPLAAVIGAFYPTADGRLILIGYHLPASKHYTEEFFFWIESHDAGYTWSEPERQVLRPRNDAVTTHSPIQLASGEYLFPGQFFEQRPQPLVAPVEQLIHATSEEEALAMPAGEGRSAYKFATHLHGCSAFISPHEDGRAMVEYGHIANRPLGLLEPTCVRLRDGRIVMLMRAEWGGCLWRAESTDDGRTWSEAWETDIPNPSRKPYLIRLSDGRIVLLHNATGQRGVWGRRDPLSIWISDDELASWSIQENVLHGGMLAYPNAIVVDGRLVFAYDRDRRQAWFVEVDIAP